MRLICPNCGAQYEVDASVIPDTGRDVQCSNCGHTWYQRAASRAPEAAVATPAAEAAPADMPPADMAEAAAPAASVLEPGVSDILREEAARETAERAAERMQSRPAETMADLGIDTTGDETPPNVHERLARLREQDDELATTAMAAAAPNRKELLPDIEEINSSLTPEAADEAPAEIIAEAARRGGFRRGFALVIILFAIMMMVYLYAPKIVQMNPATEPALAAYVNWVNNLRDNLNGFMAGAAERLTALLSSISAEG